MLVVMIAALAAAGEPSAAKPVCLNSYAHKADRSATDAARSRKLVDLPPADLVLTVLRREDGCEVPVVVRSDVGGTARPGQ